MKGKPRPSKWFSVIAMQVVVFCNTKAQCEQLGMAQRKLGVGSCAIHGDKDQWEREKALQQFTRGQCDVRRSLESS